ncbi:hypothetical protein R3P38DRAFT_2716095 [Favolaschia claudopus]|uniref:DUF6534 domain-containing protein n=1 Tax=Favolaschia claudopus TaxID=2862362 RepID=A0AAW0AXX2_9AGAR
MSEPPPQILLAGPLFVGVILKWALLGALVIQIYDYQAYFRRTDRTAIRILVHFVGALEIIQAVLVSHTTWWHLVENWGKPNGLLTAAWSGTYIPILNGIAAGSVQGFFAWRIWLFESKSVGRLSSALIVLTATIQLAGAIWVAVEFTHASRNIARIDLIESAAETWLAGSFVCDVIITVSMVLILVSARRKTQSSNTLSLLNKLIISTIETGAITAFLALIQLVLYKVHPNNYLHVAIEFILGQVYSNVLVAALNGRRHRDTGQDTAAFHTTIKFRNETELNRIAQVDLPGVEGDGANGANGGPTSSSNSTSCLPRDVVFSKFPEDSPHDARHHDLDSKVHSV